MSLNGKWKLRICRKIDMVVFQKMYEVHIVRVFVCNIKNFDVRHGFVCIFFQKVLAFDYASFIQNF